MVLAVILLGIAKAGFGGGAGVVATPLVALVMPLSEAVSLLLILLLIIDVFMLPHYRHYFDRATVKIMLIGAIPGIIIATLVFQIFISNQRLLEIFIGVLAIAYVILQAGGFIKPERVAHSPYLKTSGYILGALAGFTSTIANGGGPPASIYILAQGFTQVYFVGTMAIFIMIVNLVKLIPFTLLGLFNPANWAVILILLPLCFIGTRLGIYLNGRMNPVLFNRIIYVLLFLTGLQLIIGRNFFQLFLP